MRFLIFLLLAATTACIDGKHLTTQKRLATCETVLSSKLCGTLKVIAAQFKLLPEAIDKAVSEAVAKGKTSAEDIYAEAVNFLKNEVANKNCEDFLAAKVCLRIKKMAEDFNLGTMVEVLIKEAIAMGFPSEEKIFLAVVNLIRREIAGKTCDDLLASEMCAKLVTMGKYLKINAVKIANYIKEAMIAGYTKHDEIYEAVLNFIKNDIASLTCRDALNPKICTSLEKLGALFSITPEEISQAVKDAILKGKTLWNDIIDDVKDYVNKVAGGKKCEDLISASVCATLKSLAARLKVKVDLVDEAVRDAVRGGIVEVKKIIQYCEKYVREHITCESWLGEKTCKYIRKFSSVVGVKVQEVEEKIRDLVVQGKSTISDIYKEVISFIRTHLWG